MNEEILANLTEPQREAVTHKDGPMLVIAGAGSGKTRVVTRRIAYLLENGVWASRILAMTFTNKAAKEMRERIATLTGAEPPRNVGTFHSCCARFLRHEIDRLKDGRTSDFTIYDTGESQSVLKQALKDAKFELPGQMNVKGMAELISAAKGHRMDVAQYALRETFDDPLRLGEAAELYEKRMCACNAVDFDDLLFLMARILDEFPAVRDTYNHQFQYLLIDEYQDTNHLQYELMRLLTGPAENVHVTGDPDQSIYSWRGADYSNIMNFTKDFPNAHVVRLEQNYRSTQAILNVANQVISNNVNRMSKNLFTDKPGGTKVRDITVGNDFQEGEWLARKIEALREDGADLREMAVFYRTNSQSRLLEESLVTAGIPYQLLGGVRFYERKEVKDLLAFLRLRVNHCDLVSLERAMDCLGMGIGPKTLAKLVVTANTIPTPVLDFLVADDFEAIYGKAPARIRELVDWCKGFLELPTAPVESAVGAILDYTKLEELYKKEVDAEDRIANLRSLVQKAALFGEENPEASLEEYLEEVALVADVDAHDPTSDSVKLMTLHSSKGLEFPYVFITGVEEGYLPHSYSQEEQDDDEEERRLFYVGITRAQSELTLLHAQWRRMWKGNEPREPSRFLSEIPYDDVVKLYYGARQRKYR